MYGPSQEQAAQQQQPVLGRYGWQSQGWQPPLATAVEILAVKLMTVAATASSKVGLFRTMIVSVIGRVSRHG
jgi:hypothetical protein